MSADNGPNPLKVTSNKEQYHPLSEDADKGSCALLQNQKETITRIRFVLNF